MKLFQKKVFSIFCSALFVGVLGFLVSCDKDNTPEPEQQKNYTNVKIIFDDQSNWGEYRVYGEDFVSGTPLYTFGVWRDASMLSFYQDGDYHGHVTDSIVAYTTSDYLDTISCSLMSDEIYWFGCSPYSHSLPLLDILKDKDWIEFKPAGKNQVYKVQMDSVLLDTRIQKSLKLKVVSQN